MRPSRHIYAEPVIDARAIAREIAWGEYPEVLQAPLKHRPPNLLPVEYDGLDLYQLWEDYTYLQMGEDGVYRPRTEPKGRLVDGASVPRFAWSFLPPDGRHRRSAFCHDLDFTLKLLPKAQANMEFRKRMIEDGVSAWRRLIVYQAVQAFGDPSKSVARWSELLYPVES